MVDPRVSFSSYDGRPERITGRIRNSSHYRVASTEVRLIFQDCSAEGGCETVGDQKVDIYAAIPPGQSRNFEQYIFGPRVSAKGRVT